MYPLYHRDAEGVMSPTRRGAKTPSPRVGGWADGGNLLTMLELHELHVVE